MQSKIDFKFKIRHVEHVYVVIDPVVILQNIFLGFHSTFPAEIHGGGPDRLTVTENYSAPNGQIGPKLGTNL